MSKPIPGVTVTQRNTSRGPEPVVVLRVISGEPRPFFGWLCHVQPVTPDGLHFAGPITEAWVDAP